MKRIDVKMVSAQVSAYNARDEHLEITLLLNDGRNKAFVKQLRLENPLSQAEELFREARDRIKKANPGSATDDDLLSSIIHVRWLQDEELITEKLAKFLAALHEKIRNAKRKNTSYYDLERQMLTARQQF
jgi:hypothetical protein